MSRKRGKLKEKYVL